jgi:hypothetical protein
MRTRAVSPRKVIHRHRRRVASSDEPIARSKPIMSE